MLWIKNIFKRVHDSKPDDSKPDHGIFDSQYRYVFEPKEDISTSDLMLMLQNHVAFSIFHTSLWASGQEVPSQKEVDPRIARHFRRIK